jgi:hypothetical protein
VTLENYPRGWLRLAPAHIRFLRGFPGALPQVCSAVFSALAEKRPGRCRRRRRGQCRAGCSPGPSPLPPNRTGGFNITSVARPDFGSHRYRRSDRSDEGVVPRFTFPLPCPAVPGRPPLRSHSQPYDRTVAFLTGFGRTKSTVAFKRNFQPGRRFWGSLVLCACGRSDGACPWNRR